MRQKLPDTAGEPLMVNDIGRVVYPGEEFDAPAPVPGCVNLEPPAEDHATEGAPAGEPQAPRTTGTKAAAKKETQS